MKVNLRSNISNWPKIMQRYVDNLESLSAGAQRAKIAEKVHKPPLGVNVINFEFNGFNTFI